MQYQQVIKNHERICSMILNHKVSGALKLLREMVRASGKEFINDQLDELLETYRNILKYSFLEVKDPKRQEVYYYLTRNLLELADKMREMLLTDMRASNVYILKSNFELNKPSETREALQMLDNLNFQRELQNILRDVSLEEGQTLPSREEALVRIFNFIWLSDKYSEAEIKLLNAVCDSKTLPWYDKALVVSALTLSLMRFFDVSKFELIFRFVKQRQQLVWERAMIGLFICFLKYNDRYYLYPALDKLARQMADFPDIQKHIEAILIQFTKAKETEKIKSYWEDEIMPAVMKMRPKIEEKLDLDNIFREETGEEKNPDWETVFEDAPDLLDKLSQFSEMQMEGMDVFINAFAQLKQFPFFQQISNWLLPYYASNSSLQSVLNNQEVDMSPLFEKLENTYFMCNSDKYSFSLNMSMIPAQQKTMMMNMLNEELKNIAEIQKDENLLDSFARTKSIYTQYFQDLYRFFKLHPWKNEFDDIFAYELDLYETALVNNLMWDQKTIRNIAEFYFDKKFYDSAVKVFNAILLKEPGNLELFEKIAFCYEKMGDFANAYDHYLKADLIESNRPWITGKLAYCCKFLNRWQEALKYYRILEKNDPDDLRVQTNIAQCLIHLDKFDQALDYYFKIEVLAPENEKIRRPLAWCSFLVGKLDTARDYLERLLDSGSQNRHDLMNLGHVYWAMDNPQKAVELYRQSLAVSKSEAAFEASLNEDRKHLKKYGISDFDMDLMVEFVLIS
jgi:tetratricopeptide (TPR) repeat protein